MGGREKLRSSLLWTGICTSFWLLGAGVPTLYSHSPALGLLPSVWLPQEALLFGGKQGKSMRTLLDTWPYPETNGSKALLKLSEILFSPVLLQCV